MNQNDLFEALLKADTPTNLQCPGDCDGRTTQGFTKGPVIPIDPELPAFVGYAVTARLRASVPADIDATAVLKRRLDYYRMVGEAAATRPTVVVIEDTDTPPGLGAFWGEVNVAIHLGLGVKGVLTNGSMRDLGDVDDGFQVLAGSIGPSHAHVHVTELDVPITVLDLEVAPGDLIHADRHGAVVIRPEYVDALPDAIDQVRRRESPILEAARSDDFSVEVLLDIWSQIRDVR